MRVLTRTDTVARARRRLKIFLCVVAGAVMSVSGFVRKAHAEQVNGIPVVGVEAKYRVYDIPTDNLDDISYFINGTYYTPELIMHSIPAIQKKDVDANGYKCEFLCINAKGQVVGWNPNVKY